MNILELIILENEKKENLNNIDNRIGLRLPLESDEYYEEETEEDDEIQRGVIIIDL
jgi:hypothetical protein